MTTNTLMYNHKGGSLLANSIGGFSVPDADRARYRDKYARCISEAATMTKLMLDFRFNRPDSVDVVGVPQSTGELVTGQGRLRLVTFHAPYRLAVTGSPLTLLIADTQFYVPGNISVGGKHWVLVNNALLQTQLDDWIPQSNSIEPRTKIKPMVFEFETSAATIDGNLFSDVFLITGVV